MTPYVLVKRGAKTNYEKVPLIHMDPSTMKHNPVGITQDVMQLTSMGHY